MIDSFAPVDPSLVDVFPHRHDGYPADLAAMDTLDVLKGSCGAAAREFPKALWIEPNNWADKARDNDKYHTWPINYVDRFTNQSPTHECTCHALRTVAEGCRNRQRGIIFPDGPKRRIATRNLRRARFGLARSLSMQKLTPVSGVVPDATR